MHRGAGGGRMMPERRPARLARRIITIAVAGCASALLLGLLAVGFGTAPALGPALVPWHGAWTSAVGGKLPGAQTLTLRGLAHRAEVSFTGQGTAAISATSDNDAFLALGYVHAEFRLAEMDLERRLGAGRLAQLAGPSAVASDKFELRLGLLRTAQQEWAQTPRSSPAAQALTSMMISGQAGAGAPGVSPPAGGILRSSVRRSRSCGIASRFPAAFRLPAFA